MARVNLNIDIPNDIYEYLRKYSKENHIPLNELIHQKIDKPIYNVLDEFSGKVASDDSADKLLKFVHSHPDMYKKGQMLYD